MLPTMRVRAELAELNLRASTPATGSCLSLISLSSEAILSRAKQSGVIVMTGQGLRKDCLSRIRERARSLAAHFPEALVLLAYKGEIELREHVMEAVKTAGLRETGNTTFHTKLEGTNTPSSGIRIAEFIRERSQTLGMPYEWT